MKNDGLSRLIGACARCGTCRTICTLYPERKNENATARGKIALVDAAIAGKDEDAKALRDALLDCLLCGKCERGCPNGVPVEEVVMKGRAAFSEVAGQEAWKSLLFGTVLPSPWTTRTLRRVGRTFQKFLDKVPSTSGLRYRLPAFLAEAGRTLPEIPSKGFVESLNPDEAVVGDVTLFVGCVFDHLFPAVGRAAYETVAEVVQGKEKVAVLRDAPCCGLPALVSGDIDSARSLAAEGIRRLAARIGPIVFPCGSCLLSFKRNSLILFPEGDPLHGDAVRVADRSVDYASFLLANGIEEKFRAIPRAVQSGERPVKVGYHDPCHLTGTLGKGREPRALLLAALGDTFAELPGSDLCCGLGGTFNVRDYVTSASIGERKIEAMASTGATVVTTSCSGCLLQLRDMASRKSPTLRVSHVAEVVHGTLFPPS